MGVDKTRGDDEVRGVDGARGAARDLADVDDDAVLYADIGTLTGCAGPVDDGPVLDDEVIGHGGLLS